MAVLGTAFVFVVGGGCLVETGRRHVKRGAMVEPWITTVGRAGAVHFWNGYGWAFALALIEIWSVRTAGLSVILGPLVSMMLAYLLGHACR